jgi:hypothetical protein
MNATQTQQIEKIKIAYTQTKDASKKLQKMAT